MVKCGVQEKFGARVVCVVKYGAQGAWVPGGMHGFWVPGKGHGSGGPGGVCGWPICGCSNRITPFPSLLLFHVPLFVSLLLLIVLILFKVEPVLYINY